jgi:protease-4
MKKLILGILATIGVLAILGVMAFVFLGLISVLGKPGISSRVVLELDLERRVVETVPHDPFARWMMEGALPVLDIVDALDRAAEDRRVKGLVARVGAGHMGMAHIQEIRDAVFRFRASGKPAVVFAETFGEFGPGNGGYYLATAFDEIFMQPSGDIGLTGLYYETQFVRGTLDKLGVVPRMDQRHEYKNAMNYYTHTEYTEAQREAMQRIVDSQFGQIARGIAEARELDEQEVRSLVDRGPFIGQEALDAALVDELIYLDQVEQKIEELAGSRTMRLGVATYLERAGRPNTRGTTVALVRGYGAVSRGSSSYSPINGNVVMGSETVAGALREAIDDSRVRAILFRVDSPGGSYVASDTIWRETLRARDAGKPVIVSMGNMAGSGGYFVAMDADKIVAQPGTITASIGVLGGKLLTGGFWEKIGVSFDDVSSSGNGQIWSSSHDYSERGYERFQAGLDRIYEDFTSKVAEGRDLPLEQVQEIARGRIWTGEDALEIGLVDELGGMDVAMRLVREALELDDDASIRIKRYPRERSMWEMLFGSRQVRYDAAMRTMAEAMRTVQPLVRGIDRATGAGDQGVLSMPPISP